MPPTPKRAAWLACNAMNKTHEELAREAADKIAEVYTPLGMPVDTAARHMALDILTAITAAVQAEREQSRSMLELIRDDIRESYSGRAIGTIDLELARLSLNDSPPALSNDA